MEALELSSLNYNDLLITQKTAKEHRFLNFKHYLEPQHY